MIPSPVRPAERPVHSQPCRCARSACWEQGRSAAWPMPFRPGIPPRLRSVLRAPPAPGPEGLPPTASHPAYDMAGGHQRTGRVLRLTRPQETVCPDAAGSRGANARRDRRRNRSARRGYARRRSSHSAGHPAEPPAKPASSLLALSLGSQGTPAGWSGRRSVRAGPRGRPGGVHVRCR